MPGQVDLEVRQRRTLQIREIGRRSGESFRRQVLGCTLPVLWEMGHGIDRQTHSNRWSGLTDNYIRVYAESERDLANVLYPTRLCALEAGGVWGEVLAPA